MITSARFRYPLEPVLLMRQWARDALLADLCRINASVSAVRAEMALLAREAADTASAWNLRSCSTTEFSPATYAVVTAYLRDRARQSAIRQSTLDALDMDATAVTEKVVAASKALEAVEQHRDRVRKQFDNARASADCKLADEQWAARHSGMDHHEA
jgi:hypothetical protein